MTKPKVVQKGKIIYVPEACNMIHCNKLAQAEALVEQEKKKQARKTTALGKKLIKEVQGQFSRFTKIY